MMVALSPLPAPSPSLGVSWNGGDAVLLQRLLPYVDFVETTPGTIARKQGGRNVIPEETLEELHRIASVKSLLVRGGSWSNDYLTLLDQLVAAVDVTWHSAHLGDTRVELDLLCRRIDALQERYPVPFLLEPRYSQPRFLNELTRRTGCGLLLDVYHLQCDAQNGRLDLDAFFDELDFRPVREVHIANGVLEDLTEIVLHRAVNAEVVVYGHDALVDELARLHARFRA